MILLRHFCIIFLVGFHPSFSRHGNDWASSSLLIWLNENVLFQHLLGYDARIVPLQILQYNTKIWSKIAEVIFWTLLKMPCRKRSKSQSWRLWLALLRRHDSNVRPPGYEPGELPTAPLRDVILNWVTCCFPFASAKLRTFCGIAKCFGKNMLKNT